MKIKKLGENLYQIRISWWKWSYLKELAKALGEIQGGGKIITAISKMGYDYLVCTTER